MVKKFIRCVSLQIIILLLLNSSGLAQTNFPDIKSISVIVYDADLELLLYDKNINQQRSIASLTKIMTILYASELIDAGKISLDDDVTASANAASRGGTQIKLRTGDKFTLEELLYASALASANDAAVAIAEYIGGSERQFAKLMTERVQQLGLLNTNFVDSTGLLSIYAGNYSTAFEMARLISFAMKNNLFRQFVSTTEYFLAPQNREIRNTNALLHNVYGVDGGKTGATTPAGHCLATTGVREGRRVTIVVLGAPSRSQRNKESEELFEWAYSLLEIIIPQGETITTVNVKDGVTHVIDIVTSRNLSVFALNSTNIETETHIYELKAPIKKGEKVGELVAFRDGDELDRIDLVAAQSTGLASFVRRLWNRFIEFFSRIFGGG